MKRYNNSNTRNGRKLENTKRSTRLVLKAGTLNRPPDNSGTVQIPRPIFVREKSYQRVFKLPVIISSTSTTQPYYTFAMYAPFYINPNGSGATANAPASFTNLLTSFGAFKVKRIQLILEPLLPNNSGIVPVPYVICMAPDIPSPTSSANGPAQLEDYTNSTKVSPLEPTELQYVIPKLSSANQTAEVLAGGWTLSEDLSSLVTSGSIILTQNVGTTITVVTAYTQLTVAYEVWFKNPL